MAGIQIRSGHMVPTNKTEYELIEELAYRIYQQEGCPDGMAEEHWRRAERALRQLHLSDPPRPMPNDASPMPVSEMDPGPASSQVAGDEK